jgi:hypothetical protein
MITFEQALQSKPIVNHHLHIQHQVSQLKHVYQHYTAAIMTSEFNGVPHAQ